MPQQPAPPQPAKPFNRRLLAQGRALPPAGEMRAPSKSHLVTQERLGVGLALVVLYGVVYGARLVFANGPEGAARGDFLTPLYAVIGFGVFLAVVTRCVGRRAPRARRKVRYPAAS
ncbi:MAG: hypothetical protein VXY92_02390 [Planctomycetota bacterium]|nr:hypothetical protein [Planctomycetota bacterium]